MSNLIKMNLKRNLKMTSVLFLRSEIVLKKEDYLIK